MNAEDLRKQLTAARDQANAVARQFALGGIAVAWLFSGADLKTGNVTFPRLLIWAGVLLVLTLGLDLVQTVYAALARYWHFELVEKRNPELDKDDYVYPTWFNKPTTVMFISKLLSLVAAYVLLLIHMINHFVTR